MTLRPALQPQATRAAAVPPGNAIPMRTAVAAGCPVGDLERMMLSRVDGVRTISDLSGLLSLTTHEGAMVITRLAHLGAVSLAQPAAFDENWDAPPASMPTVPPVKPVDSDSD